jgi:hypothetical protein
LSRIQGLGDTSTVKGFDIDSELGAAEDDEIDKLDIYARFLGEDEYLKMKDNYHRALHAMTELHNLEKDRIHMKAPI